jgi:hypothetical protein
MKLLIAATILLAGTTLGHADKQQDWAACLIGQSAFALLDIQNSAKPEEEWPDAAQEIAYKKCKKPAGVDEQDMEGMDDFVNATVLSIAAHAFCPEK